MSAELPHELWIRIALAAGEDTDEHVLNSLARAVPALGRWTIAGHNGDIVGRRLDLMIVFGYSVQFAVSDWPRTFHIFCTYVTDPHEYIAWSKNGKYHRNDQAAITYINADRLEMYDSHKSQYVWYYRGEVHNTRGPAFIAGNAGLMLVWSLYGSIHRDNLPAQMNEAFYMIWRDHGLLHRVDGPATIRGNDSVEWYNRGNLHRMGGPAVIQNGRLEYFVKGALYARQ